MRSRTELVTTTFIDSEEEQTESEDSEEDWRPESARNGKKQQKKPGRRRNKRKATATTAAAKIIAKRKLIESSTAASAAAAAAAVATTKHELEDSDDGSDYQLQQPTIKTYSSARHNAALKIYSNIEQKINITTATAGLGVGTVIKTEDKGDKSSGFNLYLYKKDLDKDFKNNSHLCLWRRDGSNLLQKYIRVKTNNCEEFIFTSSSVYSSWDERRRKDFATVTVKCMEDNNRRVIITDPSILQVFADEMIKRKFDKTERNDRKVATVADDDDDDDSSNEMIDSQEDEGDYDDEDCEEEISADDDNNSAKSSDIEGGGGEYYEGEEGNTNEGTSSQPQ